MFAATCSFASRIRAICLASALLTQLAYPALAARGIGEPGLGQSELISPDAEIDASGDFSDTSAGQSRLGQSEWIVPSAPAARQTQPAPTSWPSVPSRLGQSELIPPSGAEEFSQPQQLVQPQQLAQPQQLTSSTTFMPAQAPQSVAPLQGGISMSNLPMSTEISVVDPALALGSGQLANLDGTTALLSGLGQLNNMQQMIGQAMAIPMMMAASAGMLGGGFHSFGPRPYVVRTYAVANPYQAAGFMLGERISNHLLRNAAVGFRFRHR